MVYLRLYKIKPPQRCKKAGGKDMTKHGFQIELFVPSLFRLSKHKSNFYINLFWFVTTFGRYSILYIKKGNKIAHYSYLIPYNIRFPFMAANDLQIGPCYTYTEFRGKGIYSYVLQHIPLSFPKVECFWIYTADNNFISKKLIERAGYSFVGMAKRSGILKIVSFKQI